MAFLSISGQALRASGVGQNTDVSNIRLFYNRKRCPSIKYTGEMKMKNMLVAYTTNSGTTEEMARVIATELGKDGTTVDVRRLEEVTSIEPYSAVVIGAPMILGWHRAASRFVKAHQQALSRVPVAYFISAMSLTKTNQSSVKGVSIYADPGLVKLPRDANRLGLRERYTAMTNYAGQPLKAAPLVKPVSVGIFGGKLEFHRLKLLQVLFVMLVIRAPQGSLHNWPAVRQWATNVSTAFSAQRAATV
jgi:menaquinone-dependent protoporphyrinogen oxidase